MTRILSCDLLIADVITPLDGNARLQELVTKYGLIAGGKTAINRAQFDEFSAAVSGYPMTITPGGSSANTLVTLKKLLGPALGVDFIGVIGRGLSSTMIKDAMDEAGIAILPDTLPDSPVPQTALSYVMLYRGGQRTIATYPGNAREILAPGIIQSEWVKRADVVFLQASLWQKLDPGFADRLVALAREHEKRLWLALPTYALYHDRKPVGGWPLDEAELVLGNEEELARMYQLAPEGALSALRQAFGKSARSPVGFITHGHKGAAIVTKEEIIHIKASAPNAPIVNTLGAGDTAFAGFAGGFLSGLSHHESAEIAMALAGEKLGVNAPRLPDPKLALARSMPLSPLVTSHKF